MNILTKNWLINPIKVCEAEKTPAPAGGWRGQINSEVHQGSKQQHASGKALDGLT